MFHNLARLIRYRGLIQSLVARELKARYRGSALGFFWSFINPLLLLLVYSFVFEVVMPGRAAEKPYSLFLFCGLLPWTWFSSSMLESAGVLISGGNLMTFWFFATPIIYPFTGVAKGSTARTLLNLNPVTHLAVSYQELMFYPGDPPGPFGHARWLLALLAASVGVFLAGYFLFDRLRDSFADEV